MTHLYYENIEEIDWKVVKKSWDEDFVFFRLVFKHEGLRISLDSGIDTRKRVRMCLYIDGVINGGWSMNNHPYGKYHNKKLLRPTKVMRDYEAYKKKVMKRKYKAPEPTYYLSCIFDNIAQVKKMVEGLK